MPGFDEMIGTPIRDEDELSHFGISGMRWGRRRYQNSDGSLTPLGREHYGKAFKRKSDAGAKRVARYEKQGIQKSCGQFLRRCGTICRIVG